MRTIACAWTLVLALHGIVFLLPLALVISVLGFRPQILADGFGDIAALAFIAMAVLAVWMIIDSSRDRQLADRDKRQWQVMLIATGPVAPFLYFKKRFRKPQS